MSDRRVTLRPARVTDARAILDLVNGLAKDQVMLPRSPASVVESIRSFVVAEVCDVGTDDAPGPPAFAGCGALAVVWTDIAEIRSIAVHPEHQGLGLGRRMAERLIEDAVALDVARVFAFTYVPGFFAKLGFHRVEHSELPHKVFNDCLNCPKFSSCDEIAVLRVLREAGDAPDLGPLSLPRPGGQLPIIG